MLSCNIQWNLSITDLQIKDTSVIRTPTDGPKQSAIEMCTYLTSELRTPLYYGRMIRSQMVTLHRQAL